MDSLDPAPFPVRTPAPSIRAAAARAATAATIDGLRGLPWPLALAARRAVLHPRATGDTLLVIADGLDEVAQRYREDRLVLTADEVLRLAGILRNAAPLLAQGGSHAPAP